MFLDFGGIACGETDGESTEFWDGSGLSRADCAYDGGTLLVECVRNEFAGPPIAALPGRRWRQATRRIGRRGCTVRGDRAGNIVARARSGVFRGDQGAVLVAAGGHLDPGRAYAARAELREHGPGPHGLFIRPVCRAARE